MSEGPTGSDPGQRGSDLSDLRSRLAALHGSVERLGRDDEPVPPPAPAPAPDPYTYPDPATQPPQPPAAAAPEPDPYAQPPGPPAETPAPEWGYNPYAEPAPEPPAPPPGVDPYGYSIPAAPEPAPDPYQPPPAATNGQGEPDPAAAAALANIAILDIGPFADLIELRHFEEAVARLEAVRDVRVRRFGHGRAMIELGLAGPYAIGRELFRLGRPIQVEPGPEGEIIVDFTDVPDEIAVETEEGDPAAVTAEPIGAEDDPDDAGKDRGDV